MKKLIYRGRRFKRKVLSVGSSTCRIKEADANETGQL